MTHLVLRDFWDLALADQAEVAARIESLLRAAAAETGQKVDPIVAKVSILYLALPAAATTTVMAVKAQSDATRAAQCVFVTTVFSVITLPVWSGILDMLVR